MTNETSDEGKKPIEPLEIRFNYAWNWFDFHAKQRTTLFNYFLITVGILANAYVALLNTKLFLLAGVLAVLGAIISLVYRLLDVRNTELVTWGEDLLIYLEQEFLFREGYRYRLKNEGTTDQGPAVGILFREYLEKHPKEVIQPGETVKIIAQRGLSSKRIRHSYLFKVLMYTIMVAFLALAWYSFWRYICS